MAQKDTLVPRSKARFPQILQKHEATLLSDWMARQKRAATLRADLLSETELREQSAQFLRAFQGPLLEGSTTDIDAPVWEPVRAVLGELSRKRAQQGFSPSETAVFVFSLKEPLFALMQHELDDPGALIAETWNITVLLDQLGLWTTDAHQRTREEVIARQQQELLELSTPVVTLWEGVLALPLIGTLDSARTQVVMESLLERISSSGSEIAIIDITGVPTVDTLVAQHLMKTVSAARLMGAECIISGIRPQIAQTIVHLGVDLGNVITKATLADAFAIALTRTNRKVVAAGAPATNGVHAPAERVTRNGIVSV